MKHDLFVNILFVISSFITCEKSISIYKEISPLNHFILSVEMTGVDYYSTQTSFSGYRVPQISLHSSSAETIFSGFSKHSCTSSSRTHPAASH